MKFIYLLISVILFTSCLKTKTTDKDITIVFRYDDPSVYSSDPLETKLLQLFQEENLSLTFGVIPYRCAGDPIDIKSQKTLPLNQRKAKLFKPFIKNGTLEIALHGYSHQTISNKEWTEFSHLSYTKQWEKLTKGKQHLEKLTNTTITTFIPPYNTYDINTVKALEFLGFHTISANDDAFKPKKTTLQLLSHTITLDKIQTEINKAREGDSLHPFIVVMFHEYNFSTQVLEGVDKPELTFKEFVTLIQSLKKEKDIHILSLAQAYDKINILSKKSVK